MSHLLFAFFRALRSLFAPGMFSVMIVSVAFTIAVLFGFIGITGGALGYLSAHVDNPLLASWLPLVGTLGAGFIAWFLFPGIMPVIISFFDQRIVSLIEREDYPNVRPLHTPAFWPELLHDIGFCFLAIALNIAVLPLYLVPVVNIILFPLLNGYLLGREFFVMVAKRHIPIQEAEQLRKRHSRLITLSGMALVICAVIPIVNLFAPFWGLAVMTHLYHRLNA